MSGMVERGSGSGGVVRSMRAHLVVTFLIGWCAVFLVGMVIAIVDSAVQSAVMAGRDTGAIQAIDSLMWPAFNVIVVALLVGYVLLAISRKNG